MLLLPLILAHKILMPDIEVSTRLSQDNQTEKGLTQQIQA